MTVARLITVNSITMAPRKGQNKVEHLVWCLIREVVQVVVIKDTLARMMKQEGVVGYVIVKRSAGNY